MTKINRGTFFANIKSIFIGGFNGDVGAKRIAGIDAILDEWEGRSDITSDQLAYIFATTIWETDYTVQPIKEKGGAAYFTKMYDVTGTRPKVAARLGNDVAGDGPKYAGRGFVQLTGKVNYKKAGDILGIDLINYPDKALDLKIATRILFEGTRDGWFTGKKLSTYINKDGVDYVEARRIINGVDKKNEIAAIAVKVKKALDKSEVANTYPLPTSRTIQGAGASAVGGTAILLDATNTIVSNVEAQREAFTSGSIVQVVIGLVVLTGALVSFYARWDDAGRPKFWQK